MTANSCATKSQMKDLKEITSGFKSAENEKFKIPPVKEFKP